MKLNLKAVAVALGVAGFVVIGMTAGWLPAFGVFLCLWGNNIDMAHKGEKG